MGMSAACETRPVSRQCPIGHIHRGSIEVLIRAAVQFQQCGVGAGPFHHGFCLRGMLNKAEPVWRVGIVIVEEQRVQPDWIATLHRKIDPVVVDNVTAQVPFAA